MAGSDVTMSVTESVATWQELSRQARVLRKHTAVGFLIQAAQTPIVSVHYIEQCACHVSSLIPYPC